MCAKKLLLSGLERVAVESFGEAISAVFSLKLPVSTQAIDDALDWKKVKKAHKANHDWYEKAYRGVRCDAFQFTSPQYTATLHVTCPISHA